MGVSFTVAGVEVATETGAVVSTAQQTALDGKQPLDAQLTDLAALAYAGNALKVVRVNAGATAFELAALAGGGDMLGANNLSDVANAATAFTNIKQAATTGATGVVELATDGESAANIVPQANDSRLSDARTPTAHATSHKSGGSDAIKLDELAAPTDVTTLNASTSAHGLLPKLNNSATQFLNGQGAWATVAAGDTVAQAAASAAVAINSTSVVNMASCTNTVAAGDTFSFYMTGYILNNSGAVRTYTVRLTIGATTFDLVHSTTIAASSSNVSYLQVSGEIAVISSSSIGCTINTRFGVGAAVGTAQNNVLAQDRSIVRTSGNNETGSKTIAIGILSSDATATQTFTKTRAEIRKGSAI